MRKNIFIAMAIWFLLALSLNAEAGNFVSGSTGTDGPFAPTSDTTLQLPSNGIFNFTTVNIPVGVTVKFQKNAANTPVYMLTTGDVNIAGVIDVSGEKGADGNTGNIGPVPGGKGGPGGFDGGYGGEPGSTGVSSKSAGNGLGTGGGTHFNSYYSQYNRTCELASGGSYSSSGSSLPSSGCYNYSCCVGSSATYGNSSLLPLIGGSGGGGGNAGNSYNAYGGSGGGGGGAILIASSSSINITGTIKANGGNGGSNSSASGGGGGSGGGIRLIANSITGTGSLQANGGSGGSGEPLNWYSTDCKSDRCGGNGGSGRIRVEGYTVTASNISPSPSVSTPGLVFLPQVPTLLITKIAGNTVPASASGSYTAPDITLPSTITNPISVEISASNIPAGTSVTMTATPQHGSATSANTTLVGTDASSTATANINISTTEPSVITAQTTFTVQTAMFYDGEKIEKVRIASNIGKASEVIYITETGKEIPAEKLLAMR